MQALYGWFQSEDKSMTRSLEAMFHGAERTYDLYLSLLLLLQEITDEEEKYYADLQPGFTRKNDPVNYRLGSNVVIVNLRQNKDFSKLVKDRRLSWQNHTELIKKLFFNLRQSPEYKQYVAAQTHSEEEDIEFIKFVYKEVVMPSEVFQTTIDEQNIWWADSVEFINSMVLKTLRLARNKKETSIELMPLYRDSEDDREFMEILFRETIKNNEYFESLIDAKTRNWEIERIALMDVILLKMALSEILSFPGIPVKVSINEYIDISKEYSTPKSKVFINGVLDKIVADLKTEGKIIKSGRGLIE